MGRKGTTEIALSRRVQGESIEGGSGARDSVNKMGLQRRDAQHEPQLHGDGADGLRTEGR